MEKQELPKRKSVEPENEEKVENLPFNSPFHLPNHYSLSQFLVRNSFLPRRKYLTVSRSSKKRKNRKIFIQQDNENFQVKL